MVTWLTAKVPLQFSGASTVLSDKYKWCLGNLIACGIKLNVLTSASHNTQKISLRWITDLHGKGRTISLLLKKHMNKDYIIRTQEALIIKDMIGIWNNIFSNTYSLAVFYISYRLYLLEIHNVLWMTTQTDPDAHTHKALRFTLILLLHYSCKIPDPFPTHDLQERTNKRNWLCFWNPLKKTTG